VGEVRISYFLYAIPVFIFLYRPYCIPSCNMMFVRSDEEAVNNGAEDCSPDSDSTDSEQWPKVLFLSLTNVAEPGRFSAAPALRYKNTRAPTQALGISLIYGCF
jgi:hypothetical protein